MIAFIVTLAVAAAGAALFLKLRVPVGAMVGATLLVTAYNLFCGDAFVFPQTTYVLQVCSGVLVGSRVTMKTLKGLRQLWKPYLVMMAVLISVTFLISLFLARFSGIDGITALLAMAPGGMTDMTILSAALGAESTYVALLHTCRMLVIILTIPPLIKWTCQKEEDGLSSAREEAGGAETSWEHLLLALAVAAVFAFVFTLLHIRAGAMLGAMIGSSLCTISGRHYHCPHGYTLLLQVGAGAFTGARVTHEIVAGIPRLWLPLLCVIATVWIYFFLNGYLMHRLFGMKKSTAMFSCTPGGLAEMSLLAEELGGDLPTIATLHTLRLFGVILIVPNLVPLVEWACQLLW